MAPSFRSPRNFLLLAAMAVACANRGMEAPPPDSEDAAGGTVGTGGIPDGSGGAGTSGTAAGGSGGTVVGTGGRASGGTGGSGTGGAAGQAAGTGGQMGTGGGGGRGARAPGRGGAGAGTGGVGTGGSGTGGSGSGGAAGRSGSGGAGTGGSAGAGGGHGGAGGSAPPLFAFYQFNQTAGPSIPDSSGNDRNGTLMGTASFPAGMVGNDLSLPGSSGDYVALPSGLLQNMTSITIAVWIKVGADQAWQRVFDFGSSTNVYMFLTPHAGTSPNAARFAISTSGNTNEQTLNAPAALPVGTWTHVAIVLGPGGGTLYINGASVATNAALALRPADLGATTNTWLGRSQFSDPYFKGEIDELRIYAAALTAADITAIYNAR